MVLIGYPLLIAQLFLYHTHFFDVYLTGLKIPGVLYLFYVPALLVSGLLFMAIKLPISRMWLLFLFWVLLSSALGVWRSNSLTKLMACLQSLTLFWGIVAFTVNSRLLILNMKLIGIFAMISAVLGLFFAGAGNERLAYYRGTFADANEYSIWLMFGLSALWLAMAQSKNFAMKLIYLGACTPIFWAMLKTGSRGSLLGLVVLFGSTFIASSPAKKMGVLILCLFGASSFFFLPENLKERYMTIMGASSNVTAESAERMMEAIESRTGRLEILWKSIEETIKHPLLGVGPDNFGTHYSDLVKREKGTNTPSFTTHNTYTQLSSEMGFPGLLIFLAILYAGIRNMNRILRYKLQVKECISDRTHNCAYYLRLSLIGIAAGSFFLSLGYSTIYYILTGLITACTNLADQEMRDYQIRKRNAAVLPVPLQEIPIAVPIGTAIGGTHNPVKFGRIRPV